MPTLTSKDGYLPKMTRAEYTAAKNNRTLLCPNTCLISDEGKVEFLFANPKTDIGIAAWDGSKVLYYSVEEWNALETRPTAMGVYVATENGVVCLHETTSSKKWSDNTTVIVPGCFCDSDAARSLLDMGGEANTDAVLTAVSNGVIENAPLFTWAHSLTFANGKTGYVPAKGELETLRLNGVQINACRAAIGHSIINFASNIWSSSQTSASSSWSWYSTYWDYNRKNNSYLGLALCAL